MDGFKKICVKDVEENFINLIGEDYMLITAKDDEKINMMTASWGFVGVMWNKNVVNIVVRPSRYTYDMLKKNSCFTLNFLKKGNSEILKFCGTKSGRDFNKVKETGLIPIETEDDVVAFSQSKLVFKCKKIYVQDMEKDMFVEKDFGEKTYPNDDIHTMFIAEIQEVYENLN